MQELNRMYENIKENFQSTLKEKLTTMKPGLANLILGENSIEDKDWEEDESSIIE